jgi:hypothetical protein
MFQIDPNTTSETESQMSPITEMPSSVWEYGVSIGVIILSFALIWRLIHLATEKFESITKTHAETVSELSDKHRSERDAWSEYAKLRDARITTVCDELIKAIHEAKK